MALLTYEYHDLACDGVEDDKICQQYVQGAPGVAPWTVRTNAHDVGWTTAENPVTGTLMDYCPQHKPRP